MGLHNLTYLWSMCKGTKTRAEYISTDVDHPYNISSTQKNTAQKAITWLLSKAPHSVEEIADHFEMSPQLVMHLLEELRDTNFVTRESAHSARFKLKEFVKKVGEVS